MHLKLTKEKRVPGLKSWSDKYIVIGHVVREWLKVWRREDNVERHAALFKHQSGRDRCYVLTWKSFELEIFGTFHFCIILSLIWRTSNKSEAPSIPSLRPLNMMVLLFMYCRHWGANPDIHHQNQTLSRIYDSTVLLLNLSLTTVQIEASL
jgi:hypothetical protein